MAKGLKDMIILLEQYGQSMRYVVMLIKGKDVMS